MRGYKNKGEILDDPAVMTEMHQQWHHIEARKKVEIPDTCVFARAQICKRDTNKVRSTMGYPLMIYLMEGQYFYPYLD